MADRDHVFQALVHEAVTACGSDVAAIERYVAERLGAMNEDQRQQVMRDIQRVLGFREPPGPPYRTN